ncbi:MAG: SDR family NAD(P)-dependent oxidoreductase [Gammaproteobacteria bacterium]|nr:SDR family NAD(P)-dependent oxidoreductase [Gammaproteobacteria bacterium]
MAFLNGRIVILTGASRGLGVVIARALADAGTALVLAARSREQLDSVAAELTGHGVRLLSVICDVTREHDRDLLLQRSLDSFGRVDVLVNNAGAEELCAYAEQDPAMVTRMIETNLLAPMLLSRALLPRMLAQHSGHIVNIASLAGRTGMPFGAAYAGSKGGLAEWSISLAAELAGSGVAVSVICPGFVSGTGMFARKHATPPRTLGASRPEDVANAVLNALRTGRVEIVVNPKPVRLLMALKALSPDLALKLARRLGLMAFLRQLARAAHEEKQP